MAHEPKERDEVPTAAEYGQMIAFIAAAGSESAQTLREVLGNGPQGRTRGQIAEEVTAWLGGRPKGD